MQLQSFSYGLTRKKLNQRPHISKGCFFFTCVLMFPEGECFVEIIVLS